MEAPTILAQVIGPCIHFSLLLNDYNSHFLPLQKQLCSSIFDFWNHQLDDQLLS